MKKTIHLEAMDPLEIFGAQNKILTEFCSYFPHLKVTARGTELILEGRESDIAEFNIRFAELVEKLGLSNRIKYLPNQLSGGQQQRVSIGRALMNNPALLLADEPTGNLDSENSKEIISLLRKFNHENNQTVIIITHDERIALAADRIIEIADGQIVRDEIGASEAMSRTNEENMSNHFAGSEIAGRNGEAM